jgi:hypothetical protein
MVSFAQGHRPAPTTRRKVRVSMDFYDAREARTVLSSHKTLYQACPVQQEAPNERCVVLTRLEGTKWYYDSPLFFACDYGAPEHFAEPATN